MCSDTDHLPLRQGVRVEVTGHEERENQKNHMKRDMEKERDYKNQESRWKEGVHVCVTARERRIIEKKGKIPRLL